MADEPLFSLQFLERVVAIVTKAGSDGMPVSDLPDEMHILAAGYLAGRGFFERIGGGGEEPWIIRLRDLKELEKLVNK